MMVDVSSVALSGFDASVTRINVAADNIANANTPDYRAKAVSQTTDSTGGVSTRVVAKNPAPQASPAPATPQSGSSTSSSTTHTSASQLEGNNDVDIDEDVVDANFATYSAQANLKVLQTQDKLNKYLLDIQA
jgi:flagellar basal body rod protein FlgB